MTERKKTGTRTISDVLALPAREGAPIVARVAPAISSIVEKTGIMSLLMSNTVATAASPALMARLSSKEQAKIRARMIKIGEQIVTIVLKSFGDCTPEYVEVLSALNGMSADEFLDTYSMGEVVGMVKGIMGDPDFLKSLKTFTD